MPKCSVCGLDKKTVNRDMFDGMCASCTDRALYDLSVSKRAEENNKLLKQLNEMKVFQD